MLLNAKHLSKQSFVEEDPDNNATISERNEKLKSKSADLSPNEKGRASQSPKTSTRKAASATSAHATSAAEKTYKYFGDDSRMQNVVPKLVYVVSVMSLVFLTYCTFDAAWMLPYYYTCTTVFLIWLRFIMYWRKKYLFFMLDFCYLATIMILFFIWVMPQNESLFMAVYGVSNGPMLWAVIIYRNSLVFHSIDKITSAFIHIMPAILSFSLRWRPGEVSRHWYREIVPRQGNLDIGVLVGVPFAIYVVHTVLYVILVFVILKPSEEHQTSYRYLASSENSPFFGIFNRFGEKWRIVSFFAINLVFTLVTLILSILLYSFNIANMLALMFALSISVYNGGSFYIDVFSIRGLDQE